jgi:hypothetical protein
VGAVDTLGRCFATLWRVPIAWFLAGRVVLVVLEGGRIMAKAGRLWAGRPCVGGLCCATRCVWGRSLWVVLCGYSSCEFAQCVG